MAGDFLDDYKDTINKQIGEKEPTEGMTKQRAVQLHMYYYRKVKMYAAENDIPIIKVMDTAVKHAIEDGIIKVEK
ncbi:hypothetical protein [Apilactobacillus xinyiensis]|uniref:hypothetical protein n=1 Tax=Apilactobacillus xinyiensis TaxID=2841032 RepID=UPI001C7CBB41|nr:hypothetical protein [Apilactobacillus xinyiensis]